MAEESALLRWTQEQEGDVERLQVVTGILLLTLAGNANIRDALLANIRLVFQWDEEGVLELGSTGRRTLEDMQSLLESFRG